MKKLHAALILFALIFSATAFAQRGYGGGLPGGGPKKAEKPDYIALTVDYYTKELSLDGFQAAAVREVIKSHIGELDSIMQDTETTDAEKKDRAQDVNEKIDAEIFRMLSESQKEKFTKLKEKRKH
ncbi:hypothetical protein ACLI09_03275 [Flavobacterium sp. RHBU_24]|uniref:hypothetical protein n=1 Tax=Flavobacterium sp. RHBU_24 TaxID=3391185 RepID=UPI00398545FE